VSVSDVLALAEPLATLAPVTVMAYANIVLAPGPERFLAALASAGVSGLIVPDLPHEEAREIAAEARGAGVALVPLVAPTTTEERLREICADAQGFVYVVSVVGTTGERAGARAGVAEMLARVRRHSSVPVALGFGISTPQDAAQAAAAGAEGVIVGSRLVRAAGEDADPARAVGAVVADLAAALGRVA
jgi:tryptophan synthase alpha chain